MIFDTLEEMPGTYFVATTIYLHPVDWTEGYYSATETRIFDSFDEANAWIDEEKGKRPCIYVSVHPFDITPRSVDRTQQELVQSLQREKDNVRKRFTDTLAKYDEQIDKLLAITHQPTLDTPDEDPDQDERAW